MLRSPSPAPFRRANGLQAEIDTLIERLVEIRQRQSVCDGFDEDSAKSLRDVVGVVKDLALAFDPLFHRLAFEAGCGSLSKASKFANLVTDYALDDLLGEIEARAVKIEGERPNPPDENAQHRLGAAQLGVGRFR